MWTCNHCHKEFENFSTSEKANHSRWCDKNPKKSKYLSTLENTRNNISISSREQQAKSLSKTHKERDLPNPPSFAGKFHTDESKAILRKKRIEYLESNTDKHPWKKNSKFISEPCEFLKKKLREAGLDFVEEYQPLAKRFFALDISFPDKKIGIEVNGNQHYNPDKTLKKYYRERHDLIVESGWTLIELPYIEVYRDEKVNEIMKVLLR